MYFPVQLFALFVFELIEKCKHSVCIWFSTSGVFAVLHFKTDRMATWCNISMRVQSDEFDTSSLEAFLLCRNMKCAVYAAVCGSVCVLLLCPDVWGKTGICWFLTWRFTALHRQSLPFTAVGSRMGQNLNSVLLAALKTMKLNKFLHGKRDQVWNGNGEDLDIWKMAKPIAQTWPYSGGQSRWPVVGW